MSATPPRQLKLAFAMGGGVSLGTFSGSALTETIKLALLRIVDGKADYDRVVVDVFSGASAGSLALAVMLRGLTWRTEKEKTAALEHLWCLHPGLQRRWPSISEEIQQDLIAAQVAQDLQKEAWVKQINLDQLLGNRDPRRLNQLRYAPGLLDSEAVYRIAQLLLVPKPGQKITIDRRLLADRCLFACTLTNLTPRVENSTGQFPVAPGSVPGLRDAFRSLVHRDMRVFDINFKTVTQEEIELSHAAKKRNAGLVRVAETKMSSTAELIQTADSADVPGAVDWPERWFRLHTGPHPKDNKYNHPAWALDNPLTWATLAATAVASGAFPAAFTPAVLARYQSEYDVWPQDLVDARADQHPFAYIDGGVFNNDPIREAFRMASFMDARETVEQNRKLIYVDPSVAPEEVAFGVPLLMEEKKGKGSVWNLGSPNATQHRPTLDRLGTLLGSLVNLFIHQGRARDADSSAHLRNNFELREVFRNRWRIISIYLKDLALAKTLYNELKTGCTALLAGSMKELIPAGNGSLGSELRRVIREEQQNVFIYPHEAQGYLDHGLEVQPYFDHKEQWLYVHLCLYFDLVLGLEGRSKNTIIIAITPYTGPDPKHLTELKLLGDPLAAFAGFMSYAARKYDFDAGRFCAAVFLGFDQGGFIPIIPTTREWLAGPPKKPLAKDYEADLLAQIDLVRKRADELLATGLGKLPGWLVSYFLGVRSMLESAIPGVVADRYSMPEGTVARRHGMEFAILLPKGLDVELDAKGVLDKDGGRETDLIYGGLWPALKTYAEWVIPATAEHRPPHWEGAAVHDQHWFYLDRPGLHLGHWAKVHLPDAAQVAAFKVAEHTCLRPLVVLDLSQCTHPPDPRAMTRPAWKLEEGAVPLADKLLLIRPDDLVGKSSLLR